MEAGFSTGDRNGIKYATLEYNFGKFTNDKVLPNLTIKIGPILCIPLGCFHTANHLLLTETLLHQ